MTQTVFQMIPTSIGMPLEALIGQSCWAFAAGTGTGSHVTLHFGAKVKRQRELSNPTLAPTLRRYEGSVILFIEESKWALMSRRQPVCGSDSDNAATGPMVRGLQRIVGTQVTSILSSGDFGVLALSLSKGLQLLLAPTSSKDRDGDNYILSLPHANFILGPDLKVRVEARSPIGTPEKPFDVVLSNPPWVRWSMPNSLHGSIKNWASALAGSRRQRTKAKS